MIAVMIVPTGINAEIGGHSGDATSAAHLLASACDKLIVHPNVLNASDLTEHPSNALYVEGGMLNDFLAGNIGLKEVNSNHVLVACNVAGRDTINCVNAMRSILGLSAEIVELPIPLIMHGFIDPDSHKAGGSIDNIDQLVKTVSAYEFDALAVHTSIQLEIGVEEHYLTHGGINPWGGVEAILSKILYKALKRPNAHAPVEPSSNDYGVSDPRFAPEMLCAAHLGCVLKGLQRAPVPVSASLYADVKITDVDVMISPMCWGIPHELCRKRCIPIIFVKDNRTSQSLAFQSEFRNEDGYIVSNYLEAAGLLLLMKSGRTIESVTRPLQCVKIHNHILGEHPDD